MNGAWRPTPPGLTLPLGAALVRVRPAVSCRERSHAGVRSCYLSLYEEEIDERAANFWAALDREAAVPHRLPLEPSDAFVHALPDGSILAGRGGAATFPFYWRADREQLQLTTALPLFDGGPWSRAGLVASVAGACVHGSFELNATTATPLAAWRRVRRASLLRFARGPEVDERVLRCCAIPREKSREEIATGLLMAIDAYHRSQASVRTSVVEVSGGFDSTLAAAMPSRDGMRGISVAFPYYEFRYERYVQQATADFLGIDRVEIDGAKLHPYAPSELPARFDEPSVFVTGIRHAEQVARFGAAATARRIYTGHGGDQCFATDLLGTEAMVANPPARGPFDGHAWRAVSDAMAEASRSPWMDRSLGTFVYDARPDVWVKETFGPTLRTPFSDLRMFRSALDWSLWCRTHGGRPDKSILAEAASDLLPRAVLERKGKVAYDGVWMRAYLRHADHIAATFERAGDVLSHVGISPQWLQRRVRDLGDWQPKSDREVLAAYAIANWLIAWDVRRPQDVGWADTIGAQATLKKKFWNSRAFSSRSPK